MTHIDESTVDTDLKSSIFEQQMEKFVKMTEYLKMCQRAPEGLKGMNAERTNSYTIPQS